jgi:hypothetical protein
MRAVGVMGDAGAYAVHFIGSNAYADAAATNEDPAVRFALLNSAPHIAGKVGKILRVRFVCAKVTNVMTKLPQFVEDSAFYGKTGMVVADCNTHKFLLANRISIAVAWATIALTCSQHSGNFS